MNNEYRERAYITEEWTHKWFTDKMNQKKSVMVKEKSGSKLANGPVSNFTDPNTISCEILTMPPQLVE